MPLLAAAGIDISLSTGIAGITTSTTQCDEFTSKLRTGFQEMSEVMLTIQKQTDSLAAVVLQN